MAVIYDMEDEILEILLTYSNLVEKDHGLECELYGSYDDRIDNRTITEICLGDNPYNDLMDSLHDMYEYSEIEAYDCLEDLIVDKLAEKYGEVPAEVRADIRDYLLDTVYFKYPDEPLKAKVRVDIFVDTGDANYDFTLNCRYPAWDGYEGEIDPKASIRWLAGTQGYSEPELREALDQGDMADPKTFLDSMRVELINTPSHIITLVFLAEMSVEDLIMLNARIKKTRNGDQIIYDPDMRPDAGAIHISKDAETGLFNSWDGGGGPFEIILEKDVDLPIKYIYSVLPDGEEGKWGIDDVYGMCHSCWRDVVSGVYEKEER